MLFVVMAGRDPAIGVDHSNARLGSVDARIKSGHDVFGRR